MGRKKEKWSAIKRYKEYYEISTWGRVRSLGRYVKVGKQINWFAPKFKVPCFNGHYYHVVLYKNGQYKVIVIHRLVALHFIPNPKKKPQVNHKNGRKLQNNVENLEWVTVSENSRHSYDVLKRKPTITMLGRKGKLSPCAKRIIQYSIKGKLLRKFWGSGDAMRKTGIGEKCIRQALRGASKSAGGYIWKYAPGYKVTKRKKKNKL